ncbi:hypothetical protein CCY99_04590 [Helicobacter sp. 16-1353]|uniref:glycosyltransferase family 25 protein n=1 Tax=Helicobacter sp. 16-1353 TaxID=2004996 RepID=UPI000DCD914D|nr:glycosyltransferase family 25 protein [Helicobacter sp. 16-1353]RAX54294.1 hypothetical protein CCY99_04590 [Helicobacter sp. 16-1353]
MRIFIINLAHSIERRKTMIEKIKNLAKSANIKNADIKIRILNSAESRGDSANFKVSKESIIFQNFSENGEIGKSSEVVKSGESKKIAESTDFKTATNQAESTESNANPTESAKSKKSPKDSTDSINSLDFIFFNATNAKDIETGAFKVPYYKPNLAKFIRGKPLSYAELACFSSHFRLWEECLGSHSPLVVLEDDISFNENFLNALGEICGSNFPYVRLMYLFEKGANRHICGNFHIHFGAISGTQGYYLTPSGAKKLIYGAKSWFHCVDNYMDMFFLNGLWNIAYKPFPISEDVEISQYSTIQNQALGFALDSAKQLDSANLSTDSKNKTDSASLSQDSINQPDSTNQPDFTNLPPNPAIKTQTPKPKFINKFTREISRIYLFFILKPLYLGLNSHKISQFKKSKE